MSGKLKKSIMKIITGNYLHTMKRKITNGRLEKKNLT